MLLVLLCQGCFSYRHVDARSNNLEIGRNYRIKLKDKTLKNAELKALGDSTMTVFVYNDTKEIRRADIKEMERQKFSVWKSLGYPVLAIGGAIAFVVIGYSL